MHDIVLGTGKRNSRRIGIIYSDIGTSPLYVLNGIWPASGDAPSRDDVVGGISCIIWSITLLPLVKYVRSIVSRYFCLTVYIQVLISLLFGTEEGL